MSVWSKQKYNLQRFPIAFTIAVSSFCRSSFSTAAAIALSAETTTGGIMPALDVDALQAPMRATHASCENFTYEWRVSQLKNMRRMLTENKQIIQEAVQFDVKRCSSEAYSCESVPCIRDVEFQLANLKQNMRPKKVPSPAIMFPGFSQIVRRPLNSPGVCVIGAFNYPLELTLRPVIGALAAGNPTVIKPSELAERTSRVLEQLIPHYFHPSALQVVTGGIPETQALLEKPWGMIVFTGSERVGKIVAEAAAKTLTPTILELGGKCPAIVDETATKIQNIASRIIFCKLLNAGQTCVAPDTVFVHEKHAQALCQALVQALESQFGTNPKLSGLARMAQVSHAERQVALILDAENKSSSATILYGGSKTCDPQTKYVCPTLVKIGSSNAYDLRLMKEEVFGPILPIVTFSSREQAVEMIHKMGCTPLAMTVYTTNDEVFNEFTKKCRSGMAFQNDGIVQMASNYLRHGGIGSSGMGGYHGVHSFEAFSHPFSIAKRPLGALWDLGDIRCHPYPSWKAKLLEFIVLRAPDFPVFHTGTIVKILVLAVSLKLILVNLLGIALKPLMADMLEEIVKFLRK
jgi:acyl-CoA reductase-like NAD-dependent aldehyde dehydrogenase